MFICVNSESLFFSPTLTMHSRTAQRLERKERLSRDTLNVVPGGPHPLGGLLVALGLHHIELEEERVQSQSSTGSFICFGEGAASSKCSVQSICPHLNNVE